MFKAEKIVDLSLPLTDETPIYPGDPQPQISVAAHEMIKRGIRTFFIDAINMDRTGGDSFPVHHAIAAVNGIIAENLTNFGAIDFLDPLICAFPLRIAGADGAPVRAIAMKVEK